MVVVSIGGHKERDLRVVKQINGLFKHKGWEMNHVIIVELVVVMKVDRRVFILHFSTPKMVLVKS